MELITNDFLLCGDYYYVYIFSFIVQQDCKKICGRKVLIEVGK